MLTLLILGLHFTHFSVAYISSLQALSEEDRGVLVENIASTLLDAAEFIQERQMKLFDQAHKDYGSRVREMLAKLKKDTPKDQPVYDIKAAPLNPPRELPPKHA